MHLSCSSVPEQGGSDGPYAARTSSAAINGDLIHLNGTCSGAGRPQSESVTFRAAHLHRAARSHVRSVVTYYIAPPSPPEEQSTKLTRSIRTETRKVTDPPLEASLRLSAPPIESLRHASKCTCASDATQHTCHQRCSLHGTAPLGWSVIRSHACACIIDDGLASWRRSKARGQIQGPSPILVATDEVDVVDYKVRRPAEKSSCIPRRSTVLRIRGHAKNHNHQRKLRNTARGPKE